MRCLPIALAYSDLETIEQVSRTQSKMTHFDDVAASACTRYNRIGYNILNGADLKEAILAEFGQLFVHEPNTLPTGYVKDTFDWVLYILSTANSFEEVVQRAANTGYDTDTIGAIAGGLAGLYWGIDKIPKRYVESIDLKEELNRVSEQLYRLRLKNIGLKNQQIENELPWYKQLLARINVIKP